jgi:CheY-like chemotaxis protein
MADEITDDSTSSSSESSRARQKPEERRRRRRVMISAPVRVRGVYAASNGPDEISTTVDVSRHGFLFVSARIDFVQGMTVAVTFPYSKSAVPAQAEQPGRVVRVSRMPDGRFAVAIALGSGREAAAEQSSAASASDSTGERPLVIVVDADADVRESLRSFLTTQGYEVLAVPGARQAHALLNQMLPALLIAEIEGEFLPGYDLCARIKSTPRLEEVPVVLTTRSAYPSDYSNAHSLGAIVCLAKPFRMERIGHIVRLLVPIDRSRKSTPAANGSDDAARASGQSTGDASFRLRS